MIYIMSRLKDTVAVEELPAEDSGNLMGGSLCKPQTNRVGSPKVKKDGPAAPAASEVDEEKVCPFLKIGVENLSSEGFEGTISVSDSVADCFCTDNVGSGDGKRARERVTINLNADVNVDGMGLGLGVGRWNGERLEDQDHGFRDGDLVWGKIKSQPWWPGQVYDPRDASEFALKHSQEGRVLVAFFGDGSCSWCLPSQLVPFVENLDRMWSYRPSRSFANAVHRAVDEIGRLVESRFTCGCIPLEKRGHLARPLVVNAGVKAGVLVPEVDVGRIPVPEYEPAEIRAKLVGFAKTASFESVFEVAILRSWLSAYSYKECGGRLPVYSEPLVIEGLEDNDDDKKTVVPIKGPDVDEGIALPKSSSVKLQLLSDDKMYQRRKQKSVAELMAKKKVFRSKKARKRRDGEVGNGSSSGKRGRKMSYEGSELAETTDGLNEIEAKMGCDIGSSSRERKKSKYLSPPYTSLKGRIGDSGIDLGSKLESDLEDGLTKADTRGKDTTGWDSRDQELSAFAFLQELDENEQKMILLASDVVLEVNELLLKLESAAVDRFYLRNEGYLDPVWMFVSAYRSSTYLRGSNYKIYHKCKKASQGRKKPSLASPSTPGPHGCSPKISLPRKRPADEPADDLVSDARVMGQKLDSITKILENYGSRFSSDEKSCLKDEMKRLMGDVAAADEKVRLMAEKNTSS